MSLIERLKEDHGKQRGLAGGIADTEGASDERKRLWQEYKTELVAHASAEEQTLYATLMSKAEGQDAAQHGVAEHKTMEDIVADLDSMDMGSTGWLNRFSTLRDKVEHHLKDEEQDVFPLAEKLLGDGQQEDLLKTFAERKKDAALEIE